jgi:hypothetical protein
VLVRDILGTVKDILVLVREIKSGNPQWGQQVSTFFVIPSLP